MGEWVNRKSQRLAKAAKKEFFLFTEDSNGCPLFSRFPSRMYRKNTPEKKEDAQVPATRDIGDLLISDDGPMPKM
jgi:hypothetical protein